jgi:hypothetical protein
MVRESDIKGTQRIRKPLGGHVRRVVRDVVVLDEPVIHAAHFGHIATGVAKIPHCGDVPVKLRCVVSDGKVHTYGWEVI